ncbi:hypothetical protein [Streptomyces sp. HGB0020]|uniref:hypothetical protein n=1 Tax=Streptomyces sp. HGB0020 TaxID=1078086 RepID=UPI00034E8035|nr:hypothetical protein [Streptomyces sp. HGB0020]EPD67323.1 hypothetical protein HMPREF1211_01581 [Streptomyces sp. HGB0020]
MADDTLSRTDTGGGELTPAPAEAEVQHARTTGEWLARVLLWMLATALLLFTAALAWAVTLAGGG